MPNKPPPKRSSQVGGHSRRPAAGLSRGSRRGVSEFRAVGRTALTMSLRQAVIPAELHGRVLGAHRVALWGGIP